MLKQNLPNEQELLIQLSQDSELAFARIFRHYYDHLTGFVFTVVKSASLAEEIVQDVFIKVWRHRARLAAIESFENWLFVIARNQAYRAFRQQLKNPAYVKDLESWFLLSNDSPEKQLLFKESLDLLDQAAATLPQQQQIIFRMNRMEGLSLDEVAMQLHISKNTVKAHLTKALQNVRFWLKVNTYDLLLLISFCSGFVAWQP